MRLRMLALLLACAAPGCLTGRLYEHYTVPVVTDVCDTPRGSRMVTLDSHYAEAPFTRGAINAEWWSRAIGDAAHRKGLKRVHFADLHVLGILSVYKRQRIEVWGE